MFREALVKVPATMGNLGPGFDCLGCALNWTSEVRLLVPHKGVTVSISGEGARDLPVDERNLVVQAIEHFKRVVSPAAAEPLRDGFRLTLVNRIPLGRGLGSSAAARVGGLVCANMVCANPLSQEEILSLAGELEGHFDNVASALFGGIVIVAVNGSHPVWCRLDPPPLWIALSIPEYSLPTGKAREVLPETVPLADAVFNIGRTALLIASLMKGDWSLLWQAMDDRMHQPYRSHLVTGMERVFRAAREAGALGVHLSGAGPTIAGWCGDRAMAESVAQAMCQSLREMGVRGQCQVIPLRGQGIVASLSLTDSREKKV